MIEKEPKFVFRKTSEDAFLSRPVMPQISLVAHGESYHFAPQRDITPYELAKIMEMLFCSQVSFGVDIDGWWDEAGPDIWRHFRTSGG